MKKVVVFVLAFSMLFGSLYTMAYAQEVSSYASEAEGESVSEEITTAVPDEAEITEDTQGEEIETEIEDVTEDTEDGVEDNGATEEVMLEEAVPDGMENGEALDELPEVMETIAVTADEKGINQEEDGESDELEADEGVVALELDDSKIYEYTPDGAKYLLEYIEDDNGIVIIYCYAAEPYWGVDDFDLGVVKIPSEINGKTVYRIGDNAFWNCYNFTGSLELPDSITEIGNYAFAGCSNGFTGNLILPSGLTEIGDYAFENCSGFTGDLVVPAGVVKIGDSTFSNCTGFTGNLILQDGLTEIGDWAFAGCSGFTGSLIVPEGVASIGDNAFTYCTGFTGELKLPSSLTEIGVGAFAECSGFTGSLKLPESLTSIGQSAFWYCKGFTGDLILPDSLTIIEAMTFADCTGFNGRLKLPANVTVIEDGAFMSGFERIETAPGRYTEVKCGYVGDLVLPDTLTRIGSSAFKNCSSLTGDLKLPSGLTEIEDRVFYDCNCLTGTLELPDGLITIGDYGFGGCQFTGELKLPDGLKEIKSGAFWSCEFTGDLRIPDSVERIGDLAFLECNSLSRDIYLSGNISSIENDTRGFSAFVRHGISNADIMIHAPRGSYAETYAIENGYSYTDDNGYVHVGTGTESGDGTNNNTSNDTGSNNASHNNSTTLPNSTVPIANSTKVRIAVLSALEDVNKAAGIQSGEYLQVKVSDVGDDNAVAALSNYAAKAGVNIAAVFDILLQVMSQEGTPVRTVSELTAPITFTIAVPEGIDGNAYDFGVLYLHGNEITYLPDLDNDPFTITFAADRFSVYAIVYGEKGSLAGIQMVKDSVPKTGDVLPVAIPAVITLSLALEAILLGRKKGFEKKAERMRNR